MELRQLAGESTDVHMGVDGGQGLVKVGLILTDRNKEEKVGRATYAEVIS